MSVTILSPDSDFLFNPENDKLTAGVDEAGRGPLAGPVFAGAVILDPAEPIEGLNDSKKLTAQERRRLDKLIREKALSYAVAYASVEEIDRFNILRATFLAMTRAVAALKIQPRRVLVDGNRLPPWEYSSECIISGDALVPSISAASILAKVAHDQVLMEYDRLYPQYGFASHMGYGTREHLEALKKWGPSPVHRRTFKPVNLFFEGKTDELF